MQKLVPAKCKNLVPHGRLARLCGNGFSTSCEDRILLATDPLRSLKKPSLHRQLKLKEH